MPSKKKYNARFPPARIKKIMQTDEDVGKVGAAVPVIISRALELFLESLLTEASRVAKTSSAKTLSASHLKHCIGTHSQFDFLREVVSAVPDVSTSEDGTTRVSSSERRPSKRQRKEARLQVCEDDLDVSEDEPGSEGSNSDDSSLHNGTNVAKVLSPLERSNSFPTSTRRRKARNAASNSMSVQPSCSSWKSDDNKDNPASSIKAEDIATTPAASSPEHSRSRIQQAPPDNKATSSFSMERILTTSASAGHQSTGGLRANTEVPQYSPRLDPTDSLPQPNSLISAEGDTVVCTASSSNEVSESDNAGFFKDFVLPQRMFRCHEQDDDYDS